MRPRSRRSSWPRMGHFPCFSRLTWRPCAAAWRLRRSSSWPGSPADSGPGSVADIYGAPMAAGPFIGIAGSRVPQTRDVWGSNRCDIGWKREGRHLMLFSVIDNLVKGASGQAVQNMNIRFGIPETAGLRLGRGDVACRLVVKIGGQGRGRPSRASARSATSWQELCKRPRPAPRARGRRRGHGGLRGVRHRGRCSRTASARPRPDEMDIVDMVLAGKVNSHLVRLFAPAAWTPWA